MLSTGFRRYAAVILGLLILGSEASADRLPNFVIVFTDDQGYGDLGCFGRDDIETPNLDRMAREGMRFTDFYAAQAVCSASRAALLTGCYSNRISILGALGPGSRQGIHADEMTIAEVLKPKGYATAIFGKWHLGHHAPFLPTRNGFDEYFGLPYSNDMWPFHPTAGDRFPDLPLYRNEEIINPKVTPADQEMLTTWYTENAVRFIREHHDEPFFLYVPYSMPHVPLYVSEKHRGKSRAGIYGDVITEIDWSVGQILDALKETGTDRSTLVVFTSDNGPWLSYGDHAGTAGPLREGKGTAWDGGQREPCVMWWPGKIPAGRVCREVAGTIDLLPTMAHLAHASLPDHPIDGRNLWPLLSGDPNARSPHERFLFYWGRHLHAIRSGDWKLHFPHQYRSLKGEPGQGGKPGPYIQKRTELALYNLRDDIGEQNDLAKQHPEIVRRLQKLAQEAREDLGDSARKQAGSGVRPAGRFD